MADIKHLFHINAPCDKVYQAIGTTEGLAAWWTSQATGQSKPGGNLEFRFGAQFFNVMKVIDMKPAEQVTWECTDGPADWIGTHLSPG